MPLLSRAMILRALEALARELEAMEVPKEEIVLAGGAALVLMYNARDSTRDVDVCSVRSADFAAIRTAARRVAASQELPEDWLNDGAKGYLKGLLPGDVLFDRPALLVRAVGLQQLLAMKLSAWRDDVDISDARLLLPKISGSREEVWSAIEPFLVPGRELKARYAFEDLWESVHGS
ncbi:MAG TPA: DUF6036 family nucleotidyltransferase [Thermoanaerobaculia bacterium]|nr:DUF6036 family nucleotidyltransferase [Thermoanaerobaculia bacterium]